MGSGDPMAKAVLDGLERRELSAAPVTDCFEIIAGCARALPSIAAECGRLHASGNDAAHWLDSPHAPDQQVEDHPDFRDCARDNDGAVKLLAEAGSRNAASKSTR